MQLDRTEADDIQWLGQTFGTEANGERRGVGPVQRYGQANFGSFRQERTFMESDLNDRVWSGAAAVHHAQHGGAAA